MNEQFTNNVNYPKGDILEVLKTINLLVVSLNSIGMASVDNPKIELAAEILKFLQDNDLLDKLAHIREVLSTPYANEMFTGDITLLEHIMKDLNYWQPSEMNKIK